ncbi:MAG: hypothetical protein ACXAC7_04475 [Candidatus Hodarchaeales archaeon]|jgi:hypothetical protein
MASQQEKRTTIRESVSRVGLFTIFFLVLIMFLSLANLTFNSADTVATEDANDESLANLWGSENVQGIVDNVDRSTDTFIIAGLLFVSALGVHTQFRSMWKQ